MAGRACSATGMVEMGEGRSVVELDAAGQRGQPHGLRARRVRRRDGRRHRRHGRVVDAARLARRSPPRHCTSTSCAASGWATPSTAVASSCAPAVASRWPTAPSTTATASCSPAARACSRSTSPTPTSWGSPRQLTGYDPSGLARISRSCFISSDRGASVRRMEFGIFNSLYLPASPDRRGPRARRAQPADGRGRRGPRRPTAPGSSTRGPPSTTSSPSTRTCRPTRSFLGYVAGRAPSASTSASGIFNITPPVNHPARVAERVAMLDHLSRAAASSSAWAGARRPPSRRASASTTPS